MPREWRGIAALILATGVATAIIVSSIGAAYHKGPLSQTESSLLSTVLGAAVGAVATYLGGARVDHPDPGSTSSSSDNPIGDDS